MFGRRFGKRKALGIALAVIGIGALSACHSRSPEARIDHVASKVADKLDFTDSQKVILNDIANDIKKDFQAEKEQRQAMKSDFKSWIMSDELDKTKLKGAVKAKMERMDSKVDKYVDKIAALHKTLNAEQKQQLLSFLERFGPKDE